MPTRTCIGCRQQADQAALLRLVWDGHQVVADPGRRATGRGAYLHDLEACWQLAVRRRAVIRALRLGPDQASVTTASVLEDVWERRRAGELAVGGPSA